MQVISVQILEVLLKIASGIEFSTLFEVCEFHSYVDI